MRLLIPALALTATLLPSMAFAGCGACGSKKGHKHDIVETAAEAGNFKTLIKAAKAAGLVEVLTGKGPLTVFAPTDAAFAKLPKGTLEALLKDKEALAAILKYHVVPGDFPASKVLASKTLKTAQGQSLTISMKKKAPHVDEAKIIKTDIACTNGTIHAIDTVMLPPKDAKKTS